MTDVIESVLGAFVAVAFLWLVVFGPGDGE